MQPGRLADLSFVHGNPLRDIDDAADVAMVMRDGHLFTMDDLLEPYHGLERHGGSAVADQVRAPAEPLLGDEH